MRFSESEWTAYHTGRGPSPRPGGRHVALEDKPFIAWDGEGVTKPGHHQQDYVMLGTSARSTPLIDADGIGTAAALDYMLQVERENPDAIHVGFAFAYDTEMILKDVPPPVMRRLYKKGAVRWNGYRIEYRRGKWLQVSRAANIDTHSTTPTSDSGTAPASAVTGALTTTSIRVWDVFAFFSTSFVDAVRSYCQNVDADTMQRLTSGKAQRGSFSLDSLSEIAAYMATELALLVEMMVELRERLYGAGLRISHWQGPGALASYALKEHRTTEHMTREQSPEMLERFRYAYAAGRFELFRIGWHHGAVHQYDIRSAYPNAIRRLPSLANGFWRQWYPGEPITSEQFAVYRVEFLHTEFITSLPMPFYYRDERHAIHFPNHVDGWYWAPEAAMAQRLPGCVITEGWVYEHDDVYPFAWVADVYEQRAAWKDSGNASQIALKLLLNSLYGKMAQRVGWERTGGPPKWHQLEWAGWVTSYTRAMLFGAMMQAHARNALIGVETDAVFSSEPLPLDVGASLGQWDHSTYDELIYLQSGFYFRKIDGSWYVRDEQGHETEREYAKFRGFDRGSITLEDTIRALAGWRPWDGESAEIVGTTTRFLTMGTYLRMHNPQTWRRVWASEMRAVKLGRDGKRIHVPSLCPMCEQRVSPADAMHPLFVSRPPGGRSRPHAIPWITSSRNRFREQAVAADTTGRQ